MHREITADSVGRLRRMLRSGNTNAGRLWRGITFLLAFLFAATAMSTSVSADTTKAPLAAQTGAAQADAPQIDWAVAKLAYQKIEGWVKAESVGRKAADQPLMVKGVMGVKVTLRYGGLIVGAGDAMTASADTTKKVDLHELTAKATGLALVQYLERRKAALKAVPSNPAANAGQPLRWKIDVDLQVAHSPESIVLTDDAPKKAVFFSFAGGFHGLRMSHHLKESESKVIWPSSALAANMRPDSQISRLLAELKYPFSEIQTIQSRTARSDGPQLERFEVIHLVRPPNSPTIRLLTRGNEIKSANDINMAAVQTMNAHLYEFLERRISSDGTMPGTYHPTADRYKPLRGDIEDIAITASALAHRARHLYAESPNSLAYHRTKESVRVLTGYLRTQLLGKPARSHSPEAMAHLLNAIILSPNLNELKLERDQLSRLLIAKQDDKGRFIDPVSKGPVKPHAQAIITAALVETYGQSRNAALPDAIRKGQDALWTFTTKSIDVVSAQPWMADALFEMNRLLPAIDEAEKTKFTKRVETLQILAESLRKKKMVRGKPAIGPVDVEGGIDLINEVGSGVATPDWRTAHVLAFLSGLLREGQGIKADDRIMVQFDCTMMVRFLNQLMFDEASIYYVRSRTDTMHGVRFALWDNRLHLEPTALTLLATTRFQEALTRKPKTANK